MIDRYWRRYVEGASNDVRYGMEISASTGSRKRRTPKMVRRQQPGTTLFAIGLAGLGILSVLRHDFAYTWQPVPLFHPGREALAVVCGLFMVAMSFMLLFQPTVKLAARAVFVFLLAWLCLKVPALIVAPQMEAVWLGFGEIAMLFAGGWMLFARMSGLEGVSYFRYITGDRGARMGIALFGLALIPVGLSHLVYIKITAILVPEWMHFREGFGYLTGVGQMACGLAILFRVMPRIAAWVETAMLALFAFLFHRDRVVARLKLQTGSNLNFSSLTFRL
jgi:uncharacterized membrane protein